MQYKNKSGQIFDGRPVVAGEWVEGVGTVPEGHMVLTAQDGTNVCPSLAAFKESYDAAEQPRPITRPIAEGN